MITFFIFSFIALTVCTSLIILWSVINRKPKIYKAIGTCFILFMLGAAISCSAESSKASITTTTSNLNIPFVDPVQQEAAFKASAQSVTPGELNKSPTNYIGQPVSFTGIVGNFIKDSGGNTLGINITDSNGYSVEVSLSITDTAQVNTGDSIAIWGKGSGVLNGTNASGTTVSEFQVTELYLQDTTNGYTSAAIQTAYFSNDGVSKIINIGALPESSWGFYPTPGQTNISVWVNTGTDAAPIWQALVVGTGAISQVDVVYDYLLNTLQFASAPPDLQHAIVIQYTML